MFTTKDNAEISRLEDLAMSAESSYIIVPSDLLEIEVFTKDGERIIDPEFELISQKANISAQNLRPSLSYLVLEDGTVKLPMIGLIKLSEQTRLEAENTLQDAYGRYYESPFVHIKYLNKRVVVLGAGGGHVIPLQNTNTKITEVLAIADGIHKDSKVNNIRLLRNDKTYIIDLSTIGGYLKGNIVVEPGDIIYIEPIRRPVTEFFRDNGPVVSVLSSIASLVIVLISLN